MTRRQKAAVKHPSALLIAFDLSSDKPIYGKIGPMLPIQAFSSGPRAVPASPPRRRLTVGSLLAWGTVWLATAVLCLLTIAGFLARAAWVLELTSHFRLQYLAGLGFFWLLFLVRRKWPGVLVAGSFAAINLLMIAPFYRGPLAHAAPASSQQYRALSLNVMAYNDSYDEVLSLIREADPDFVTLQEMRPEWLWALRDLESEYPYHSARAGQSHYGTVLYSRIPVDSMGYDPQGDFLRPAVVAEMKLDGRPFSLIAAHTRSPVSARNLVKRNAQLVRLAELTGESTTPVLLIGDLNVSPWSPYFLDLIRNGDLMDARHGFGVYPSWPTFLPVMGIPIDHALASPEVDIHDFQTGPYVGSDHRPIIVDFSLN